MTSFPGAGVRKYLMNMVKNFVLCIFHGVSPPFKSNYSGLEDVNRKERKND